MSASPRLLFVKASRDICSAEVEHLKTVADMFLMESEVVEFRDKGAFEKDLRGRKPYNYIYLAAHADSIRVTNRVWAVAREVRNLRG